MQSFYKIILALMAVSALSGCASPQQGEQELTRSNLYGWNWTPKPKSFKHSGDFTEQVLILSDRIGLIKHLSKEKPNVLGFTLAEVEWDGDPEYESLSGYGIKRMLAPGVEQISLMSNGRLLVDIGTPRSELRYILVDLDYRKNALHANDLMELPLEKVDPI